MKKTVLAVLMVMVIAASLGACGSKDDSSDIVGKWNFVSMGQGEEKIEYKDLVSELNEIGESLEMYIDVKADKTFVMINQGEETKGTWSKDGDDYKLDVKGEVADAKVDGKKLTIEQAGIEMEYEKN